MRRQIVVACSAVVLSASPSFACPWNGCGSDAYNATRAEAYAVSPPVMYAAPVYTAPAYYTAPTATVYGNSLAVRHYAQRKRLRLHTTVLRQTRAVIVSCNRDGVTDRKQPDHPGSCPT